MAFKSDPFPSSLPNFVKPENMNSPLLASDGSNLTGFFDSALPFDSAEHAFSNDELTDFTYRSHTSTEPNSSRSPMSTAFQDLGFSLSPESSPADSSSDSSVPHQRKGSSNSSHSGLLGGHVAMVDEDHVAAWSAVEGIAETQSSSNFGSCNVPSSMDFDFSNSTMDKVFDFDSAASSPGPQPNSNIIKNSTLKNVKMPFRSSPRSVLSRGKANGHRSAASTGQYEISPLSSMHRHQEAVPTSHAQPAISTFKGDRSNEIMTGDQSQPSPWPIKIGLTSQDSSSAASSGFHPPAISKPFESPVNALGTAQWPPQPPVLTVHRISPKSRVETQIPVKLTMSSLPVGVTKLHVPVHTVARPRQVAKKPPKKSPEMLELSVELVCTSAMQDPEKRSLALARASSIPQDERKEANRRLPSGVIPPYAADDPEKPSNGGCVLMCDGCMKRELKRADRKKSKNLEEEDLWMPHSGKRIIIFNSNEVKDWDDPFATKDDPKKKDRGSKSPSNEVPVGVDEPPLTPGCVQVQLPMRIGCYCRHQEEKTGFQVIFTIKDHEDRFIAQAMTNSIMITDDHKTRVASPSTTPMDTAPAESAQLPGAGVFPREPTGQFKQFVPPPVRNSYSTTDLQNLQQTFVPQFLRNNSPFAVPQNFSHCTSTTLTPQNLSRPASPSAPSERHQKRRKASGSGNVPSGLVMTKLNIADAPRTPMSDLTSAVSSNGPSPTVAPYSLGGWTLSNRPGENPPCVRPLPTYLERQFRAEARSQSMEDLTSFSALNSAVASGVSSRVASPTSSSSQNHPSHFPQLQQQGQADLQALQTNAIITSGSPVVATQRQPTIHKLIPAEGSKSGGIEVTCLGSGFHPGLQVMFGDALATTTTFWGESSLVCLLPPALHAGPVAVRFIHNYPQNTAVPSTPQTYFTYINDDEPQIIKHALMTLVHKFTGRTEDPSEIVRKMRNGTFMGSEHRNGNSGNGGGVIGHAAAAPHLQASEAEPGFVDPVDLESWLLRCLDLIDLDDSPFPPRLNMTRPNGQTMLHLSASLGFYRFVAALLARGAHPDLRDNNGMSPMHIASLHNRWNIVRKLRLAGGDPRLRSLRGYTPADMASTPEMCEIIDALERSSWSLSARATPTSQQTRASSESSFRSLRIARSIPGSVAPESVLPNETDTALSSDDEGAPSQGSNVAAAPPVWVLSRRNSTTEDNKFLDDRTSEDAAGNDRLLAAANAWSAWRDQIAAQVQQLQQSVHRTLPNLPIPNLPPMPNLPDYQDYPMMRRISSLVPQRYPRSISRDSKDNDYHWWGLLKGTAAPPPYDELYPHEQQTLDLKKASVLLAAGDIFVDENCAAEFDANSLGKTSVLENMKVESQKLTPQQRAELMAAHALKAKRLRSDRKLFFFWIPLLVLVMMAMLKDRVPQLWHGVQHAITYVQNRYQQPMADL